MAEQVQYELTLKDLLTNKLHEADGAAKKLEGTIGTIGAALGIAFGVSAVVGFGQKVLQAGTYVENARTGLTTLLKDSNAAASVVKNTMEDATKTPFAFEGLLSANKALISAGADAKTAREDVLNLANAIAATGGGDDELQRMVVNMQQIKNTGKATALDIKQFAYAGVNVYQLLADATGKPIDKIKDMEVSYDMLTMALKKAHDEGGLYAGGLENMAGNTSVQISNLGDSMFQLSVRVFDDLKPAIDIIIKGLSGFVSILSNTWDWLVKNKDIVQAVAVGVGVAAVAYGVYTLAINATTIATTLWTAAQWALNVAMTANPIGVIIVAIGALAAGVMYAYNHFAKFRGVIWATWAVIKEFVSMVVEAYTNLYKIIHGAFTFNWSEMKEGMAGQVNIVLDAAKRIGAAAKKGYEEGMADFGKDEAKEKSVKSVANAPASPKKPSNKTTTTATEKSQTKGAVGTKAVTITIHIGSLIKDFQIKTTNIQESTSRIREKVTEALISATNDSQIIAGTS